MIHSLKSFFQPYIDTLKTWLSEAQPIQELSSTTLDDGETFFDVFPSIEIVYWWQSPLFWGCIVSVLLIGTLIWLFFFRKKDAYASSIIPLTPYEQALKSIEQARSQMGHTKRFACGISNAVRTYLEQVFSIPATERTTEEFFDSIAPNLDLNKKNHALLADFSQKCDLVKFSQDTFSRKDLEALYKDANLFVEQTHAQQNPLQPPHEKKP